MKSRCSTYPGTELYEHYCGRGIRVCRKWRNSFKAFLADVGPAPSPAHTLDRIDNNKGYRPGNVRWATMLEQARNKPICQKIRFRGESKTLSEWVEATGINQATLSQRLWWLPPRLAFTLPPLNRGPGSGKRLEALRARFNKPTRYRLRSEALNAELHRRSQRYWAAVEERSKRWKESR